MPHPCYTGELLEFGDILGACSYWEKALNLGSDDASALMSQPATLNQHLNRKELESRNPLSNHHLPSSSRGIHDLFFFSWLIV